MISSGVYGKTPRVCPTPKVDRDRGSYPGHSTGPDAVSLLPRREDRRRRNGCGLEGPRHQARPAVTHPNIAAIHEIDEAEGVTFISMELVDGRTLRSVIGGRPMPIPEALRIASVPAQSSFIRKTNVGPRAKS